MVAQNAAAMWNALRGIVCVYKPAEASVRKLRRDLIMKICKGLNEVDENQYYRPFKPHTSNATELIQQSVDRSVDLRDHPLVYGPKFDELDLSLSWSNFLGWNTSGVLLFGLRSGTQSARYIRENRSSRAYRIKGVFGQATDTGFKNGKVVERSTWRHIKPFHFDKILSAMQAAHQKKMFEMSGIDMQSQLAYELAAQGPIRPINSKLPIIYGIKCIDYEGPEFTLEIQCINEYETYLVGLIHEIGVRLHSTAHCTAIKCIRHSYFNLDHALLSRHWDLKNILQNIRMCNRILAENEHVLKQTSIALR
ncbi:unnamed protein product [Callosobruchus maculatus]|uniref:Pseudouridine synthase II N-terminal domain-containing protein n=2 Tax=Callosobruchus maculatus TaxID=64391 RepID=A0A653CQ35_CALMS|nr:unnamed protein product [Callosobruchus maculatus]